MTETLMTWADVLADPNLRDLPYRIELNEEGQIVMSPTGNKHGIVQTRIVRELAARPGGTAWVEGSIQVASGAVYVADVVWLSDGRKAVHGIPDPMVVAPEICVEVVSPSNSRSEMRRKTEAYLAAGAQEVWIVDLDGNRVVHTA